MEQQLPQLRLYITSTKLGFNLRVTTLLIGEAENDMQMCFLGINTTKAKKEASQIHKAITALLDPALAEITLDPAIQTPKTTDVHLSALGTSDLIESGFMPYGAHENLAINTISTAYLSSCIKQLTKTTQQSAKRIASQALASLALRGELNQEDVCSFVLSNASAKKEMNQISQFVGAVKQRIELIAVIEFVKEEMNNHRGRMQYFYKLRAGANSIMYSGSSKLESDKGLVKFKATVKEHHLFKGIRTTVVERPKLISA